MTGLPLHTPIQEQLLRDEMMRLVTEERNARDSALAALGLFGLR